MTGPPYPAMTIAQWFVAWAAGDEEGAVTNLKLQKLLYYAQGHHLARSGVPLFSEPISAWSHGPVVRPVYHAYKEFAGNEIRVDGEFNWDSVDEDTAQLLIRVWETYGGLAAWRLREMTHSEPPWASTFRENERDVEIPVATIRDHFIRIDPA